MLEILGKAAVSAEPGECSFDELPVRHEDEALGGVGPFDDFERPFADPFYSVAKFVVGIPDRPAGTDFPQQSARLTSIEEVVSLTLNPDTKPGDYRLRLGRQSILDGNEEVASL
jgi:hypothetical protein